MGGSWRFPAALAGPLAALSLVAAGAGCGGEPEPSLAPKPIVLPSQGAPPPPRPKSLAETTAAQEVAKSDAPSPLDELAVEEALLASLHAGPDLARLTAPEAALRKVAAAWPKWAVPHVALARLALSRATGGKGKPDAAALAAAEAELTQARKLDPKLARTAYVEGELALVRGDLAAAAVALARAEELAKGSPEGQLLAAAIAQAKGDQAGAVARATPVLAEGTPKRQRADAHAFLGRLRFAAKDPVKAVPDYRAALAIDGGWTSLRLELVEVLTAAKQFEAAMEVAQEAERAGPSPTTKTVLAAACKRRGEELAAKKETVYAGDAWKCAAQNDPRDADNFYGLGQYYRAVAEAGSNPALLEDSDDAYKAALLLKPNHAKAKAGLLSNSKMGRPRAGMPGMMPGMPGMPPGMPGMPAGMPGMPPGMGMPGMPAGGDGHDHDHDH